jgi:peptidyl-prolyl cis-trans isomerase D
MLDTLRKGAGTWIVKIFLGLLVLSFAAWGIGDLVRNIVQPDTAVATVGDIRISQNAYINGFNRDLRNLQLRSGGHIDAEQARQLGLPRQTLDRLISQALYDEAARRLGLLASEEMIRKEILEGPTFKDSTGTFSPGLFERLLNQNGFTEQTYIATRKVELVRQQLFDAVIAGGQVPKRVAEEIYRQRNQRRVAEIVRLPHKAFDPAAAPDEATLADYHKAHATRYTAPEMRKLTFVVLRPDDFKAEVAVDPKDVRESYESRLAEFTVPEKRQVEQILVPDETVAKQIADRLAEGGDFYAVAKQLANKEPSEVKLGELSPGTLPEAVDKVVFSLDLNKPSQPVKSPFGWHILRVTAIAPGHQMSFDEAKAEIEDDLRLDHAHDALYEFSTRIEDTLASGATLEEAAQQLQLKLQTIDAVDAQGLGPDGKRPEALPKLDGFLETAFEATPGQEPELKEVDRGTYYIVQVDKVMPPALRPLDQVRDQVRADWTAEASRKAAEAKAKQLAEKARDGESIDVLTKGTGFDSFTTKPLTPAEAGSTAGLERAAVEALFKLKKGEVATGENATGGATLVFRLKQIVEADPSSDAEGVKQMREGLNRLVLADLLDEFKNALKERIGVEVNQQVADSIFEQSVR